MLIWAVIVGAHLAIQASTLPAKVTAAGSKFLLVLWIVSLTLMGMRIAGNLVRYYGEQAAGVLPVTTLTQTLAQLSVVILGLLLLLSALDFRITPILTALGVGGLAVALALQDTLSNLFSGFYVAVARQIRMGDYIRLNTGEEGYVSDIGWRSTTLRSLGNNMILVPNAKLAQAIVTNFHLPEKRMGTGLQIPVSLDSDPDQVERVLLDVARHGAAEIPGMVRDPAPSVSLDPGFADSSLGFTLGFQVEEFSNQFGVKAELRKRILRRFREEGIAIPYPARAVYLQEPENARHLPVPKP
jgi:small-conductance mechanosensitive channel